MPIFRARVLVVEKKGMGNQVNRIVIISGLSRRTTDGAKC